MTNTAEVTEFAVLMFVDTASDFRCADCAAGPLPRVWVCTDGRETWLLCGSCALPGSE